MLLQDDLASQVGGPDSNRSSADHSLFRFSLPVAYTTKPMATPQAPNSRHQANASMISGVSISPTTANFSMATGSPGSLFLRPEHEMLLEDMESLDLGARGPEFEMDGTQATGDDGW